jgi:ABC-type bacteriocin/lantibiotic exporter with double-glycine peptidase domain
MRIKAYGARIGYRKAQGSMLSGFKKLWAILQPKERRGMVLLLFMIIVLGFIEIVGVGSMLPFLSVAATPDVIETNKTLSSIRDVLGIQDRKTFLVILGIGAASLIVVQNLFHILVMIVKSRYGHRVGINLSWRLLGNYLAKPYVFFLNENSSILSRNVLGEAQQVVSGYITPLLEIITDIVIGGSIVAFLVAVQPTAAIVSALAISLVYGGIYFIVKGRLVRLGQKRLDANKLRFKAVAESLTGIKDVKLLGKEHFFLDRYVRPSKKLTSATIKIEVIGKIPNYILNTIIFGGVILIITILLVTADDFANYIPLIGVYGMAATKLLPRFKELFANVSKLRAYQSTVELMLENLQGEEHVKLLDKSYLDVTPLPFTSEIELRHVTFSYPLSDSEVIGDQSIRIRRNSTVGLVGATGCGKTTLVDIILGLLRPQSGDLLVDGTPVTEANLREWQANLGYVPQAIYLSDDSVTANIAFGVPEKRIDHEAVRKAAEVANLARFIETELPEQYATSVKERGLRLSGGQKQRLGIARALYSDPSVLVLDEATSALDGVTEGVIMEAIDRLGGKKTIVIIAHRLTTLINADVIYMMDKGLIVDQGTYQELMQRNEQFKKMARIEG